MWEIVTNLNTSLKRYKKTQNSFLVPQVSVTYYELSDVCLISFLIFILFFNRHLNNLTQLSQIPVPLPAFLSLFFSSPKVLPSFEKHKSFSHYLAPCLVTELADLLLSSKYIPILSSLRVPHSKSIVNYTRCVYCNLCK